MPAEPLALGQLDKVLNALATGRVPGARKDAWPPGDAYGVGGLKEGGLLQMPALQMWEHHLQDIVVLTISGLTGLLSWGNWVPRNMVDQG